MTETPHPRPGDRFGRLTVIKDGHPPSGILANGHRYLLCRCTCGNQKSTTSAALRSGRTRSCGCLHRDLAKLRRAERLARELRQAVKELPGWPHRETALESLLEAQTDVDELAQTIELERAA